MSASQLLTPKILSLIPAYKNHEMRDTCPNPRGQRDTCPNPRGHKFVMKFLSELARVSRAMLLTMVLSSRTHMVFVRVGF